MNAGSPSFNSNKRNEVSLDKAKEKSNDNISPNSATISLEPLEPIKDHTLKDNSKEDAIHIRNVKIKKNAIENTRKNVILDITKKNYLKKTPGEIEPWIPPLKITRAPDFRTVEQQITDIISENRSDDDTSKR